MYSKLSFGVLICRAYGRKFSFAENVMFSITVADLEGSVSPVSVNVDNNGRYRSRYCKQDHVYTKRR